MSWLTNPFAVAWKAKLDKKAREAEAEHDEQNKDCPQNRCGEWTKCTQLRV